MANIYRNTSPSDMQKLKSLLKWARTTAHPFTSCRNALVKRGTPVASANRICARFKDIAMGTTKWRKGSRG